VGIPREGAVKRQWGCGNLQRHRAVLPAITRLSCYSLHVRLTDLEQDCHSDVSDMNFISEKIYCPISESGFYRAMLAQSAVMRQ